MPDFLYEVSAIVNDGNEFDCFVRPNEAGYGSGWYGGL
jgi:hypothetical protein